MFFGSHAWAPTTAKASAAVQFKGGDSQFRLRTKLERSHKGERKFDLHKSESKPHFDETTVAILKACNKDIPKAETDTVQVQIRNNTLGLVINCWCGEDATLQDLCFEKSRFQN